MTEAAKRSRPKPRTYTVVAEEPPPPETIPVEETPTPQPEEPPPVDAEPFAGCLRAFEPFDQPGDVINNDELGVYAESDSGGAFVFFPLADAAEVAHYKSLYESDWPDPNTPPNEQIAVVKGNVMAIAERYGQWTPGVLEAYRVCAS